MLAHCYLVHGGEPLQTEEIIQNIKQLGAKSGYNKYVVFELNTQSEWDELLNTCQNLDLFAERTIMELRLPSDSVSKQGSTMLESILHQQDDDFCIVIRALKLKTPTLNSNWVKYIQQKGKIYLAKSIPTSQWHTWVSRRLAQIGFTASNKAITYIAKCYEGNLTATAQCINKIAAVLPPGKIDLAQILPFIDNNTHFSIFELSNAALDANSERTFTILNTLKNDGTDPVLVLWNATKEIRTLLLMQHAIKSGAKFEHSATQLGIWRENLPRIKQALQRLSTTELEQLLHLAKNIDTTIKGMQPGDCWQMLTSLYLAIAGKPILTTEDLYI